MVVQRSSLKNQVLAEIRQRLVAGDLLPGRTYSAAALAAHLGTSTGPVREAMLTLMDQGIVKSVPNVGYEVVELTEEDLDEIHDLRKLLELPAVERVSQRETCDLSAAREHAHRCAEAAKADDVTGFLTADRDFHLAVLTEANNSRLVTFVATLRDQTRLFGLHGLAIAGQLHAFAAEHFDLLNAVEKGDPRLAVSIMRQHLDHVRHEWAGRPHTA